MTFKKKPAAITAALAAALSLSSCAAFNQAWHTGCGVTAKETLYKGGGGGADISYVRRLATTCGQFEVGDAWEAGVTNSYDLWSKFEVGKFYDIKTGGFRVGVLSQFPIVVEVTDARV